MKKFSVIIPTLNEKEHISDVLTALSLQSMRPFEVFIIDGNSVDNTIKIAEKFCKEIPLSIVRVKRGVGIQRTLGGKMARGEICVFLDADVCFDPQFIEKSLIEFENRKLSCACPVYIPQTNSFVIKSIYALFNSIFFWGQKMYPAGAGSCIFVTKKVFERLGGFNHRLLTDDLDFIYRAGKSSKFGQLHTKIVVSDRRFHSYGVLRTFYTYLKISYFFLTGQLQSANTIQYAFGAHVPQKSATRSRTS